MTKSPKVFLSHSHQDRYAATQLQRVIITNGGETYLDQDNIQAGDLLPLRIQEGIDWCNTFLLLWSVGAARSKWVVKEWNMAYDLRKKIIPYLLDNVPLPDALDNLVYVSGDDHDHADAALLLALFGKSFVPDPSTVFPGKWRGTVDAFGLAQGIYDLTLRANGQIEGSGGMGQGGDAGELARIAGAIGLLNLRFTIHGNWSYDQNAQLLTLNLITINFGQQTIDNVRIHTNGKEKRAIQGQDIEGRQWTFQRV